MELYRYCSQHWDKWYPTETLSFQKNNPVTLDNLQTSVSTVSFETISPAESRSNENYWNWDLRIIYSNLDTIFGKSIIHWVFFSTSFIFFHRKYSYIFWKITNLSWLNYQSRRYRLVHIKTTLTSTTVFLFGDMHCWQLKITLLKTPTYFWILSKFWINSATLATCFVHKFNNKLFWILNRSESGLRLASSPLHKWLRRMCIAV